jgi:hypothetical protein
MRKPVEKTLRTIALRPAMQDENAGSLSHKMPLVKGIFPRFQRASHKNRELLDLVVALIDMQHQDIATR